MCSAPVPRVAPLMGKELAALKLADCLPRAVFRDTRNARDRWDTRMRRAIAQGHARQVGIYALSVPAQIRNSVDRRVRPARLGEPSDSLAPSPEWIEQRATDQDKWKRDDAPHNSRVGPLSRKPCQCAAALRAESGVGRLRFCRALWTDHPRAKIPQAYSLGNMDAALRLSRARPCRSALFPCVRRPRQDVPRSVPVEDGPEIASA